MKSQYSNFTFLEIRRVEGDHITRATPHTGCNTLIRENTLRENSPITATEKYWSLKKYRNKHQTMKYEWTDDEFYNGTVRCDHERTILS